MVRSIACLLDGQPHAAEPAARPARRNLRRPALCRTAAPRICRNERAIEEQLLDLAYAKKLPLVATNDVHFGPADMYEAHDALLCIADGTFVDAERPPPADAASIASRAPSEMEALFSDLPEAIENTVEIARRCAFRPKKRNPILPRVRAGVRPVDSGGIAGAGRGRADAAPCRARPLSPTSRSMTNGWPMSSASSIGMGFPGYFLIVSDFMKWTRAQRHSGRRARLRRLLAGGLGARHHQPRSLALRPVLRALPQSRTHLDAGLRYRFLPGAARRGRALCAATNMAATAWRRSSRWARCRRAPRCATSAACCRCRSAWWTASPS